MSISPLRAQDYNPDILNTLANLSSDEVFTPPEVANQVLDLLPQELFLSPDTTFLDPATKSGVFLREIARRLMVGLAEVIPDEQERRDHIFHKQLYGIAITELTSLMSRRSLYCSKFPNGRYSVSRFDSAEGNIRFKQLEHRFVDGRCVYCGARENQFGKQVREGLEYHAYEFIHTTKPEEIFNMKFDVIIGNPPYQLDDGGSKASSKPIYHLFIEQAQKLSPRFLTMIVPARWYSGGKGLDAFRETMLKDQRMTKLVDYFDSTECFPGVDISGGVCYFLWDRDNPAEASIKTIRNGAESIMSRPLLEPELDFFIRFNEAVSILRKVRANYEDGFSSLISSRKPFGLDTKVDLSNGKITETDIYVFAYPQNGYISKSVVTKNINAVYEKKVFVSYAYGERGSFPYLVIGKPFLGEENTCCTETYLMINSFDNEKVAINIMSYMRTKFCRFLVLLRKNTQHATKNVYSLVPLQDFSKPWTDAELYAKYGLNQEEIDFIESMIRPMDTEGDNDDA